MGDRGGGVGGGAVVPVAAKTRKRRAYLYIFNSVAAIASVLCVFVVNTVGTIRTIQILIGSDTNSTHSDDGLLHGYKAYYTPYLLREVLVAPATVQTRIDAILASGRKVGYLEMDESPNTTTSTTTSNLATWFRQDSCRTLVNATTDRIYNESYVAKTLVPMLLAGSNASDQSALIVVDCSFEGRKAMDTTNIKLYLLDRHLQWLVTYQLQTIMANIPARRDTMPTGTVSYTNLSLASLSLGGIPQRGLDFLAKLTSSEPAVHQLLCSRGFPFNAAPFDAVVIESVTDTGAWNTSVVSTGLQMVLQGFGGMYRGSQNEQANYKTFVWVLDPDPLQVVFNFHFAQVGRTKNSWAWGQALISGFLSFGVVTSTVMACIISRNILKATQVRWIPDISPSVQSGIMFRGILTVIAWWIDGWWAVQEWCFQQGNVRRGLLDMYVLTDSVKSDCLSLFLAGASFIASRLRLRINPAVPVVIYLVVYSQRAQLVAAMGLFLTNANLELEANQALNVVLSETTGLDMWMWHEKKDFNATVVFNELSWMVLALILMLVYAITDKIYTVYFTDHAVEAKTTKKTVAEDGTTGGTGSQGGNSGSNERATCFETSTGEYLRHKYGLMSYHENYLFIKGLKYASPSDDIMKVCANILLRHDIFRAHCHVIAENQVDKTVIRVFRKDITLKQLFNLSLRPLA
ncbi:hypothetical protein, variant [Aphanomyces astaci]|uniref:Uncharacterized protein n=1 Tax=Aphanomyces astaci TaxID=112090 RepID=W4FC74_APHAT|nr:hypothetical protein, variant [Aphanomyces astaci]ETV64431.1 hypothetical protein, variant [Aphanomyces astaci]|eukprot:XP_009846084.1 hypothetical protein, variant [Aphanomyces astaci]